MKQNLPPDLDAEVLPSSNGMRRWKRGKQVTKRFCGHSTNPAFPQALGAGTEVTPHRAGRGRLPEQGTEHLCTDGEPGAAR